MIKILFSLFFMFFFSGSVFSTEDVKEYIDFDEVRSRGGFNSIKLSNVVSIIPSGKTLTTEEKNELSKSQNLKNIRRLDLRKQDITDKFVEDFCNNKTFSQIISLNLSENPIKKSSIEHILHSKYVGSMRDLPQISGRYGINSSQVYVRVENVEDLSKEKDFITRMNTGDLYEDNFEINYLHSLFDNDETSVIGIKLLELQQ